MKTTTPNPVVMELYNHSGKAQMLNPFEGNPEHTGVIHKTDNFGLTGEEVVEKIRLHFIDSPFLFCSSEAYLCGEKINLTQYFSLNQIQSDRMEIRLDDKLKNIQFKKMVNHQNWFTAQYFLSERPTLQSGTIDSKTWTSSNDKKPLNQPTMWCFVSNTKNYTINANLIELCKGNTVEGIELISYNNNVYFNNPTDEIIFNKIKVASSKTENIHNLIKVNNSEKNKFIVPTTDENQFQNWFCETPINLNFNKDTKIEVTIPPYANMMWHLL